MLLPRFSIRTMLAIATGVAVISIFAGQALGGKAWAMGLTAAVVSVPVSLAVQALFFAVGSAFARWLGPQDIVARTNRGGVERSSLPSLLTASPANPTAETTPTP
jgi:hypothetical protein